MREDNDIFEDEIFSDDEWTLVLTVVKRGFETDVLESAKLAGSTGGILVQAKTVSESQKKFLGVNIDPESTMVLMLVKRENVVPTMKSIYSAVDFTSEAKGMVFALPVSLVAGMEEFFDKADDD